MTLDKSKLEDDILQFVGSRIPNHPGLAKDTDLLEDGLLDSLLLMDLIFQIEDRYALKFGSDQINPANFRTVSTIASFVLSQSNPQPV